CLAYLIGNRSRMAGRCVNLDHPIHLMPALIVFKREGTVVLSPDDGSHVVRVWKKGVVDRDLLLRIEQKKDWLLYVDRIARLGVFDGPIFRLKLVGGRRLDILYFSVIARADSIRRYFFRIRRPRYRAELISVSFRTVEAQGKLFRLVFRPDDDVVIPDE